MEENKKNMTREEVDKLFAQDEEGRYINLIIPARDDLPELNLIGKYANDLNIDEIVRMKQYANKLYEEALKNTLE